MIYTKDCNVKLHKSDELFTYSAVTGVNCWCLPALRLTTSRVIFQHGLH